ncbi:MAG: hypothetical protein DRP01_05470 [Archaeoglobales archaeon]|nr:MAG: hypothetical protein DRP01_05470 [Archaeoglobales archaeon]
MGNKKKYCRSCKSFLWEIWGNNINLELFARYLMTRTFVVVVRTNSSSLAFKLFITVNSRGTPLTNADMLKNYKFRSYNK